MTPPLCCCGILQWNREELFRKSFLFIMWWNEGEPSRRHLLGLWAANTSDTPRTAGSTWKSQRESISCSQWPPLSHCNILPALIMFSGEVWHSDMNALWKRCVEKKPTIHSGLWDLRKIRSSDDGGRFLCIWVGWSLRYALNKLGWM